ncbi:hypothetical protein SMMN14_03194 [Sphaerulina musiva]
MSSINAAGIADSNLVAETCETTRLLGASSVEVLMTRTSWRRRARQRVYWEHPVSTLYNLQLWGSQTGRDMTEHCGSIDVLINAAGIADSNLKAETDDQDASKGRPGRRRRRPRQCCRHHRIIKSGRFYTDL